MPPTDLIPRHAKSSLYSWVSGISSCTHPAVWATLLHYKHSKQLTRKVEKGSALCLVYCTGSQPQLFQFNQDIEDQFTLSTAELKVEVSGFG